MFAIVLAAVWSATQWTAAALGYQAGLGAWFIVAGFPIYLPWRLFEWWYSYDAYAPHVFERGGAIAAGGGVAAALFAILHSVWRARQNKLVTTYGSARWATRKEIASAGLFKPTGVFLGRLGDDYLRHDGPEHVMGFAPTRSGKGVGLVAPTLLSWPASAVIHDIKGENWPLTAAGGRSSRIACCSIRPIRAAPATTRCSRSAEARAKSATCRTSPTSWSTRKARWSGATIGRRPATRCWSGHPACPLCRGRQDARAGGRLLADPAQRSRRRSGS